MKIYVLILLCIVTITTKAQSFKEISKIVASDRAEVDEFGISVSIFGDYAMVGSWYHDVYDGAAGLIDDAGAVYIYKNNGNGAWDEVQQLVASDPVYNAIFGRDVFIYGNYAIVGAPRNNTDPTGGNIKDEAGAAYILYRNEDGTWSEIQKIVASDREEGEAFGYAVSMSNNYAIIGAYREDEDANGGDSIYFAGAAYIFEQDDKGLWQEVQKIVASDREYLDIFGYRVSISGGYAIVGACFEDDDSTGQNFMDRAGSAYIFERESSGNWTEVKKLVASDRTAIDQFGFSVSISGDYAIVGANMDNENANGEDTLFLSGSAYIFKRTDSGTWQEKQKIVASDRDSLDYFGFSVYLTDDYAIVGAGGDELSGSSMAPNSGSVYIFSRNSNDYWLEKQKIMAWDNEAYDWFGNSVSMYNNDIIVGAMREDEDESGGNTITDAGSAYIFTDMFVGMNNYKQEESIYLLYPNPATEFINIELKWNQCNPAECQIYDMFGRIVMSFRIGSNQRNTVDVSGLSSGVYLIKVVNKMNEYNTTVIIK